MVLISCRIVVAVLPMFACTNSLTIMFFLVLLSARSSLSFFTHSRFLLDNKYL
jgi:hypothetical protein